jgi:hypothetical protein
MRADLHASRGGREIDVDAVAERLGGMVAPRVGAALDSLTPGLRRIAVEPLRACESASGE